jgi:hypothetical protein
MRPPDPFSQRRLSPPPHGLPWVYGLPVTPCACLAGIRTVVPNLAPRTGFTVPFTRLLCDGLPRRQQKHSMQAVCVDQGR